MSYAGFLIAVLIACFLVFSNFKTFFKESKNAVNPPAQGVIGTQETSASTYQSTVKNIHFQLDSASQKEIDRAREMEDLK